MISTNNYATDHTAARKFLEGDRDHEIVYTDGTAAKSIPILPSYDLSDLYLATSMSDLVHAYAGVSRNKSYVTFTASMYTASMYLACELQMMSG